MSATLAVDLVQVTFTVVDSIKNIVSKRSTVKVKAKSEYLIIIVASTCAIQTLWRRKTVETTIRGS